MWKNGIIQKQKVYTAGVFISTLLFFNIFAVGGSEILYPNRKRGGPKVIIYKGL